MWSAAAPANFQPKVGGPMMLAVWNFRLARFSIETGVLAWGLQSNNAELESDAGNDRSFRRLLSDLGHGG